MTEKAILFDATKCMGCRGCQVACKEWNDLKGENTANRGTIENPPDLSAVTWLKMKFMETGDAQDLRWHFGRRSCMHCTEAACVDVCPTKALYHHDDLGFVALDKSKCSGCGYCVAACPFDVPRSSGSPVGIRHANKCILCHDRIESGNSPACVKSCPPGALVFGDRSELLATGKARVNVLKAKYPQAYLYGENELGGLHVMYVLEDSPSVYGLPENPKVPVAATVWQDIVRPVGWAVAGLAVLGLGLNYVIAQRKIKLHSEGESHGK